MRKLPDLTLYLVLDPGLCVPRGMVATAVAAVAGGAGVVQLRDKTAGTAGLVETGRALMAALDGSGATVIVNDDVEAALAIGAHGLHVGQSDTAASDARARLGPGPLLGVSVESLAACAAIDASVVDYVGAGPVFATATKSDHKTPVGFDGLAELVAAAPVPAVAIGGVKLEHAAALRATGAAGMAVVSAICGQPDPQAASQALRHAWETAAKETAP